MNAFVGKQIVIVSAIRYWSNFALLRGETGEIIDVDPETGDVFLKLDKPRHELQAWNNCISVPGIYDRHWQSTQTSKQPFRRCRALAAGSSIAATIAMMLTPAAYASPVDPPEKVLAERIADITIDVP